MIMYDRTVTDNANVRRLVEEARRHVKTKLGFQNCDAEDEALPSAPVFQNLPPDLLGQLAQLLEKDSFRDKHSPRVPYAEIIYGGDPNCGKGNKNTPGPWACTQGMSVWLFDRWLNEENRGRRAAVLAHELVHVLCGNELDSEITENVMFEQEGSTIDPSDVYSIRSKRWRGRWFRVVRPLGRNQRLPIDVRYGWRESIGENTINNLLTKLGGGRALPQQQFNKMFADVPVEA